MAETMTTMLPWNRTGREHEPARDRERPSRPWRSQAMLRSIVLFLFLLPFALAANDPGHDTLYIEETGSSELAGDLNITQDLRVDDLFYSSNLDIMGNGSQPGNSRAEIYATSGNALYINAPGNLYFGVTGSGSMVYLGSSGVHLNVSGDIYSGGELVCLADGTNCAGGNNTGNVSSVTAGDGLTDSGTASDPVLNVNPGAGLEISGDAIQINSTVCTTQNGLCEGSSSAGGWTNTTTTTSTGLDVSMGSEKFIFNGSTGIVSIAKRSGPTIVIGDSISSATYPSLTIGSSNSNVGLSIGQDSTHYANWKWVYDATPANAYIQFSTYNYNNPYSFEGSAVYFQVISGGNVGIGTTTPSAKLDVNGSINVTGDSASIYIGADEVCTAANGLCNQSVGASASGTDGTLARFNSTGGLVDSIVSESGSTLTIAGNISMPASFYIGSGASVTGTGSLAIGSSARTDREASIAIGANAVGGDDWGTAGHQVIIGDAARGNDSYQVIIGADAYAQDAAYAVLVGYSTLSDGQYAVGVGYDADPHDYGTIAIGASTVAKLGGMALGYTANASHTDSVALGKNAKTTAVDQLMIGASSDNLNTYIHGTLETSGAATFGAASTVAGSSICTPANGLCNNTQAVPYQSAAAGWTNTSTTTATSLNVNLTNGNLTIPNGHMRIGDTVGQTPSALNIIGDDPNDRIHIGATQRMIVGESNPTGEVSGSRAITAPGGIGFRASESGGLHMIIRNNSRVGIMDVTPSQTLGITGNIGIGDTEVISSGRVGSFATGTTVDGSTVCTPANGLCNQTATGNVTGTSGASGRVAYWSSDSEITGSSGMTFDGTNLTIAGDILMTEDDFIGIGSSAERIVFDGDGGDVRVLGASLIVGTTDSSSYDLDVQDETDTAHMRVLTEASDKLATHIIVNSNGGAAIQSWAAGPAHVGTYFGVSSADSTMMLSNQASVFAIGTYDAVPFILGTQNVERMRFTSDGYVAINNTDPNATLHVGGTLATSGAATIGAASTVAGSSICTPANGLCNQTDTTLSEASVEGYVYDDDNALAAQWTVTSNGTYDVNFDSNTFVVDASEDRVGIGLTAPTASLEIRGDYERIFRFSDSGVDHGMTGVVPTNVFFSAEEVSDDIGGIQFRGLTDTDGVAVAFVGISGAASPTKSTMTFWGGKKSGTSYGALAASEKLVQFSNYGTDVITVLGDGKTGFGTSDPNATLHVVGTLETSGAATIGAASTVAGSTVCTPANGLCNQTDTTLSEASVEAYVYDNDNALAAQWTVTSDGTYDVNFDSNTFVVDASEDRVGIGLAAPSKALEVSDGSKGITFDPTPTSPTINTTSGNLTIDSAGGYVIINLG